MDHLKCFSAACYVDAKGLKMKTSKSIAAVVVLLIIMFLVMGATDLNHCPDDSIAQLKARIISLEQRVEDLEKKLQTSATKRSPAMTRPSRPSRERSSATRRPSSPSPGQSLPRGWRRKEFNGIPYYIVPLGQKQTRPGWRSSSKTRR